MSETSDALSESSLKRLTVPQLRALCKERCITGYGKIPKDSVIAKLLQWQQTKLSSQPSAGPVPPRSVSKDVMNGTTSSTIPSEAAAAPALKSHTVKSSSQKAGAGGVGSTQTAQSQEAAVVNNTPQTQSESPPMVGNTILAPEILRASVLSTAHLNKRPPIEPAVLQSNSNKKLKLNTSSHQSRASADEPGAQKESTSSERGKIVATLGSIPKKRFVPLVPQSGLLARRLPATALLQQADRSQYRIPDMKARSLAKTYRSLDFETSHFDIHLKSLLYPPSLSQRKRVPHLALILSEISYNDLKSCATVSRSFRYAGVLFTPFSSFLSAEITPLIVSSNLNSCIYPAFLAATEHLRRHFPGKRTDEILAQYPTDRTNFWPYLMHRQHEAASRGRIYEESFLGQALKGTCAIKKELWGSPSHERQVAVAVRFLLTKMYSTISVGGENEHTIQKSRSGTVLDAEEIVKDEVWKITFLSDKLVHVFYVLEATCEVIGQAEISGQIAPGNDLRADWSQYIATRTSENGGLECANGLWNKISWTNHEEYDRGISKLWLSRSAQEGAVGQAKLQVARRYILACVVCNSVSGSWQSSIEMCQDFNGARKLGPTIAHKVHRVNLFLPAHHHVESVHFNLGRNGTLHPALAVIQTPAREYYVLRDNGMQVGCEEDGIAPVWKQIVGM